ncbi:MAG: peptidylprolyl isomerase [Gemmatimonadota bacterium]|nr:peptidylprolyl isomerase [Gemmatimonadota bacterium]
MAEVKEGDKVRVHYTGWLEDESRFDSSEGRDPLEFVVGQGEVLPDFESAVIGMSPGDEVETRIPAAKAYGEVREDLVLRVDRSDLPEDLDPEVGQRLDMRTQDGNRFAVTVTEQDRESITLDANHPLAGEDLRFEIELVEIV